ncbi:alpha/beta hydrolase family protein [Maricaulis parjimensis]|uniref:alpha/beta hydrolase family protein n=1 Tax=Maricaulis parjimensis TaxID=144023 RepID=UPI00193A015E|nr:CocE/NonD family hydrolase [Maricaulis parjimensis]
MISARYIVSLVACLTLAGTPALASPLSESSQEEVWIEADDVRLGATLYRPAGATGDLPAIVTAHGSAPSTRDGVGYYTNLALSMGFAVLSFDKRGTGLSSGEYVPFSVETSDAAFHELARDVAFAMDWLVEQDGIDNTRLGLLGGSQAGWIMPLADTMLQEDFDIQIHFIITGEGVPVSAGVEQAQGTALVASVGNRQVPTRRDILAGDAAAYAYDGPDGFDPSMALSASDTPIFWIFGLSDWVIPVMPSIDAIGERIAAGETRHHLHILPFGDHNFTNTSTGERYDLARICRDWLVSQGVLAPE